MKNADWLKWSDKKRRMRGWPKSKRKSELGRIESSRSCKRRLKRKDCASSRRSSEMMPRRKSDWLRSRCARTRDSKEKLLKKRRNKKKSKKDSSLKMNALRKRESLKSRLDRLQRFESSREKTRKRKKKLPDKSRRSRS